MTKRRALACPVCQSRAEYSEANPWRPFCSERCRQLDLGAWASERYRIAAPPEQDATPGDDSDPESR